MAHNRRNAACAAAIAAAAAAPTAIDAGLRNFAGLEHRLELVGTIAGRDFYNDSMATTPESTAAALAAFSGRAWLLAGGYDKGVDMCALGRRHRRTRTRARPFTARSARVCTRKWRRNHRLDLPFSARRWPPRLTGVGGTRRGRLPILSPGCASYDQFADYRERGAHFRALVDALAAAPASRDAPCAFRSAMTRAQDERRSRTRTLAGHVETLASTKSIGYSASMSCPERCSSHGIASRFDGCENFLVGRSNGAGSRYLEVFFAPIASISEAFAARRRPTAWCVSPLPATLFPALALVFQPLGTSESAPAAAATPRYNALGVDSGIRPEILAGNFAPWHALSNAPTRFTPCWSCSASPSRSRPPPTS